MIKSVTVVNYLGDSLKLELDNPWDTGLIIESIDGLGPPKANINFTDLAMGDGSVYNSARIDKRNIVMHFVLVPIMEENRVIKSVSKVRRDANRFFLQNHELILYCKTDSRECLITGYVESIETEIFSELEHMNISIVCPDPFFYTKLPSMMLDTLRKMMASNQGSSYYESEIGFILKLSSANPKQEIVYNGDISDIGLIGIIEITGSVGDITIVNEDSHESITIYADKVNELYASLYSVSYGSNFISSDMIAISTYSGNYLVKLRRNGKAINIISAVDDAMNWPHLITGLNNLSYLVSGEISNVKVLIDSSTVYKGV